MNHNVDYHDISHRACLTQFVIKINADTSETFEAECDAVIIAVEVVSVAVTTVEVERKAVAVL